MKPELHRLANDFFLQVCDLPEHERSAYLQAHCDDPAVRDEVASLLAHHDTVTLLKTATVRTPRGFHASSARRSQSARFIWLETRQFLGRLGPVGQLSLGVVFACLILVLVAGWVQRSIRHTILSQRTRALEKVLADNVQAIELWAKYEQREVDRIARDRDLLTHVRQLLRIAQEAPTLEQRIHDLREAPEQTLLRAEFREWFVDEARFAIWSPEMQTLADWSPSNDGIGRGVTPYGAALLTEVFQNRKAVLQIPAQDRAITVGYPVDPRPQFGVLAPIRDGQETVAVLLVYNVGADERFTKLLTVDRFGTTDDTFAFDRTGLVISRLRYLEPFQSCGLLSADATNSALQIVLRDPGGDLTNGFKPKDNPSTWPLTTMARSAVQGIDGIQLDGYRNALGQPVIGVWKWVPRYGFGVATEIQSAEVDHWVNYVRFQLWAIFSLLAASLVGTILSARRLVRERKNVQKLGQYTLEQKIGEGGMGVVYRARHAFLKRPTAVKFLKPQIVDSLSAKWFQREVQLASQLTHPNTIDIYDFGVNSQGVFYCAMEFLPGLNLDQMLQLSGPIPVGRLLHLLRQIAGSLREAHTFGLVHRDIKPANIMVTCRGGVHDVIKVLDFGLAKDVSGEDSATETALAGTLAYMAPERLELPSQSDARSDTYSFGAVAFKLLTGREFINSAREFYELAAQGAAPIGHFAPQPIPASLDTLLVSCLAHDPSRRPASMQTIIDQCEQLASKYGWCEKEAHDWWHRHEQQLADAATENTIALANRP